MNTYRHTTRSESTAREAHQDNLIAWLIIRCDETISLPNVLSQSSDISSLFHYSQYTHFRNPGAEDASSNHVSQIPFRPNTRLVVHDLDLPIQIPLLQGAIETRHIRRDLKRGIWLLKGRFVVALVAVDPGPVQTQNKAFPLVGHCVPRCLAQSPPEPR